MNPVTTFTDFLLEEERNFPKATGNFTLLLIQIENAAKVIASHVRQAGLVDILGKTGKINAFSEEVQKLDEFANNLLVQTLTTSGQTHALVSEEMDMPLTTESKFQGEYIVYFDPLDGSSNIDTNSPVGTIFSVYHKDLGLLQKGENQVAAGYFIYGSSTMLVYTTGREVNGFTLDPSMGSFLLSHKNIKIPDIGNIYSINEAYENLYDDKIKSYLDLFKTRQKSSARYVGSLIADIHRTLLKGGIFLYPQDRNHKEGKLRLMLEVNPMALLVETAGGSSYAINDSSLRLSPTNIHQRVPIVLGSKKNVEEYRLTVSQ